MFKRIRKWSVEDAYNSLSRPRRLIDMGLLYLCSRWPFALSLESPTGILKMGRNKKVLLSEKRNGKIFKKENYRKELTNKPV